MILPFLLMPSGRYDIAAFVNAVWTQELLTEISILSQRRQRTQEFLTEISILCLLWDKMFGTWHDPPITTRHGIV